MTDEIEQVHNVSFSMKKRETLSIFIKLSVK